MGNELLGFINKCNEAIRVESVEFAFPISGPTLEDYRIVEMECPQCGSPLSQYYSTLLGDVRVHCPDCGSEIPKNKALKSKRF